jgi:hypothetical protein
MSDVDALCDHALACSKYANQTHQDKDHQAAKQAHESAHLAATMAGRPSLAQTHLQAAALHDKHADPTTPEGKGSLAHRLTMKARQSGKPEDHEAAHQAHQDAGQAHQDGGNMRESNKHFSMASDHQMTANKMRNPAPRPGMFNG